MLIKKFFTKTELIQLVTSNYFSILYYNSEIWHIPSPTQNLKKNLLTASAAALKMCVSNYDSTMSYKTLHSITNRAEPNNIMQYKHAITLYKVINNPVTTLNFISLFFNQNFNERNPHMNFTDNSRFKIGKNLLSNRLVIINNKIVSQWLNLSLDTYKLKCKSIFIPKSR